VLGCRSWERINKKIIGNHKMLCSRQVAKLFIRLQKPQDGDIIGQHKQSHSLEELSIKGAGISSSIKERYYSHLLFAFE
jgi:hypothetical protein